MLRKLDELHCFVKMQNLKCIYSFWTVNPGAQTTRAAANLLCALCPCDLRMLCQGMP